MDEVLWYAVPRSTFRAGTRQAIVTHGRADAPILIDVTADALLGKCSGARTLQDHATSIVGSYGGEPAAILRTLRLCADRGLLAAFRPRSFPGLPREGHIDTIGIATSGRRGRLEQAVRSISTEATVHGRRPCVLVADGSTNHDDSGRVASILRTAGTGLRIVHADHLFKKRLVARLTAEGFPRDLLVPGLCSGSVGANRNLLLLLSAGRHIIFSDDDILWKTWAPLLSNRQAQRFVGHIDPREAVWFATRSEALSSLTAASIGLIQAHEDFLGHSLDAIANNESDYSGACDFLLDLITTSANARLRVTQSGLAGDSGVFCAYGILFSRGPARDGLAHGAASLGLALVSREVQRFVTSPTISHQPFCMAGSVGLANDELLPPFMPLGTNEDGVFASTLSAFEPSSLFAHIPVGIVHDSDRAPARDPHIIPSASMTRLADVVHGVIRLARASSPRADRSVPLHRLGETIGGIGMLSRTDFREFLTDLVAEERARQLLTLDDDYRSVASLGWKAAIGDYRTRLLSALGEPLFSVPVEFRTADHIDALTATQGFLKTFGRLLCIWPALWDSARTIGIDLD